MPNPRTKALLDEMASTPQAEFDTNDYPVKGEWDGYGKSHGTDFEQVLEQDPLTAESTPHQKNRIRPVV